MNNTNPRDAPRKRRRLWIRCRSSKCQTSNYSAEYGRVAGRVVNLVMKRGGNQLHGSLFEFVRNDMFDARNYFDSTSQKSELRRNQFGATVGGPVSIPHIYNGHDHTFFLVAGKATGTCRVRQDWAGTQLCRTRNQPGELSEWDAVGDYVGPQRRPTGLL